jgi:hypothetical protein
VSGLRRSGILLLLLRPRKEGWLGWERESEGGQDRRGMLVLGRGGDVEWMHSNASIIDKGQSDYDCSVSLVLLRKPSDDTRPNSPRVAERGRSGSLLLLDPTQVLCKALLLASFHIPHPSPLKPSPMPRHPPPEPILGGRSSVIPVIQSSLSSRSELNRSSKPAKRLRSERVSDPQTEGSNSPWSGMKKRGWWWAYR